MTDQYTDEEYGSGNSDYMYGGGDEYGGDYGSSPSNPYDDFDMYANADYDSQDQWSTAMGGQDFGEDLQGPKGGAYMSGPSTVVQGLNGARAQWAPEGDQGGGGLGGYSANIYAPKPGKSGGITAGTKPAAAATKAPRQTVQISRQQYEGNAPALELPTYDEREIKRMTQEELSPAVRELRAGFRRAMMQTYENPAVRGSVLAKAMEGYGIAVGRAMSGARSSATQRYQQQFGISRENAIAKFQAALDAYKRTARTIQFQEPFKDEEELTKITKKDYGVKPRSSTNTVAVA